MTEPINPITCTIPFDLDGRHNGHLILPWSRDDSAWGSIRIPIAVIKNGSGPTALITGGNHGDEYEGPLAIVEWLNSVDLADVHGRVIALPFMNYPAFEAATRTSPIDGGNMNRIFPGDPAGTPTAKIAHYIYASLLPMADAVLDFHSGGKTLDFVPLAACHQLPDEEQTKSCIAARDAFGAPFSLTMRELDSVGMYDTAAEELGKTFVTTELGGGGTSRPELVSIARSGLRNFLRHFEILKGANGNLQTPRRVYQPDQGSFYPATDSGMIELMVELGASVSKGAILARIWPTGHLGRDPMTILAEIDGILIGRHFPGLVKAGDCVAVLAVDE